MKSYIYKLDVHKLKSVPVDLKKKSDITWNEVVEKTVYNELVKKVNTINNSRIVKKKIYDNKISDIEGKIPSIAGLANIAALGAFEKKITHANDLLKKAEYDSKLSEIEKICFITSNYNKFTNWYTWCKYKRTGFSL